MQKLQLARDTRNPRRNSSLSLSQCGGSGRGGGPRDVTSLSQVLGFWYSGDLSGDRAARGCLAARRNSSQPSTAAFQGASVMV